MEKGGSAGIERWRSGGARKDCENENRAGARIAARERILPPKADGETVKAIAEKVMASATRARLCMKKCKAGGPERALLAAIDLLTGKAHPACERHAQEFRLCRVQA